MAEISSDKSSDFERFHVFCCLIHLLKLVFSHEFFNKSSVNEEIRITFDLNALYSVLAIPIRISSCGRRKLPVPKMEQ